MPSIDAEFKALIPPLSEEEYKQLEENILKDGIRDSITVWDAPDGERYIVDGHNRYEIAQRHGLPYSVRKQEFEDRDAVIRWIILNQFGRRNLSKYDRSILALKLKPMIAEQAKEKMTEGINQYSPCQKSDKPTIDTKKELAKVAGVSHDTIHKVETIQAKASDAVKAKVQSGEMSINEGYNVTVKPENFKKKMIKQAEEEHESLQNVGETTKTISFTAVVNEEDNLRILAIEWEKKLFRACNLLFDIVKLTRESDLAKFTEILSDESDIVLLNITDSQKYLDEIKKLFMEV